jgi:prevent-host-death family protein
MPLMNQVINLYEAKTQLSSLVEEAAAGAEIIIAKAGRPRARLVAIKESARRQPGKGKGRVWVSKNFDAPLPKSLLKSFAGG